jgi:hypothetical protein
LDFIQRISDKILEQKDYLLRNWRAGVDTFFGRTGQKGQREATDEKQSVIG